MQSLRPMLYILHLQLTLMKAVGIQQLFKLRSTGMHLGVDHCLATDPGGPQSFKSSLGSMTRTSESRSRQRL